MKKNLKKVLQRQKKLKGGRNLWDFSTPILLQNSKKIEGGRFGAFFSKKVPQCQKTQRGPISLAQYCMLRGKKGKTFLVQFPGKTGTIKNFVELLVELFWSLQLYQKNTDEKR